MLNNPASKNDEIAELVPCGSDEKHNKAIQMTPVRLADGTWTPPGVCTWCVIVTSAAASASEERRKTAEWMQRGLRSPELAESSPSPPPEQAEEEEEEDPPNLKSRCCIVLFLVVHVAWTVLAVLSVAHNSRRFAQRSTEKYAQTADVWSAAESSAFLIGVVTFVWFVGSCIGVFPILTSFGQRLASASRRSLLSCLLWWRLQQPDVIARETLARRLTIPKSTFASSSEAFASRTGSAFNSAASLDRRTEDTSPRSHKWSVTPSGGPGSDGVLQAAPPPLRSSTNTTTSS